MRVGMEAYMVCYYIVLLEYMIFLNLTTLISLFTADKQMMGCRADA